MTDTIYLRASVASVCNLDCVYCPKPSGMEDRTPAHLRPRKLHLTEYLDCLRAVAAAGVRRVSFTGGEPTTNNRLPEILAAARQIFDIVELTSNGHRLAEMMPSLAPHLDLVKVSLDTLDRDKFVRLTRGSPRTFDGATRGIDAALSSGVPVGINFVLMQSTEDDLEALIDYVRTLHKKASAALPYLSVLDFYFSKDRRTLWEREFIPISRVERRLVDRYQNLREETRFGCRFAWINCDGVEVRFKESAGATMRGSICAACEEYCQEGLYGLKLSTAGWLTTCPSNAPALGSDLFLALRGKDGARAAADLLDRVRRAAPDAGSFATLLRVHDLHPFAIMDETSPDPL